MLRFFQGLYVCLPVICTSQSPSSADNFTKFFPELLLGFVYEGSVGTWDN